MPSPNRPVVFACAGCSSAGRHAYDLALELDRRGEAEMSCLAGLAAKKTVFLRKIEGRRVWIVDGCPIECSRGVLDEMQQPAHTHIRLYDFGVKKNAAPDAVIDMDRLVELVLENGTGSIS